MRVDDQRAEADIVAADRHQHEVDRPLARSRRAPVLGEGLRRRSRCCRANRPAACRRALLRPALPRQIRSLSWSNCGAHLAPLGSLNCSRGVALDEQALRRPRSPSRRGSPASPRDGGSPARAGADAERIAVLRAVAVGGTAMRAALVERALELARGRLVDSALPPRPPCAAAAATSGSILVAAPRRGRSPAARLGGAPRRHLVAHQVGS